MPQSSHSLDSRVGRLRSARTPLGDSNQTASGVPGSIPVARACKHTTCKVLAKGTYYWLVTVRIGDKAGPTIASPFQIIAAAPASGGLRWCVDRLRSWLRAPFKLFALCLLKLLDAGAGAVVVLADADHPAMAVGVRLRDTARCVADSLNTCVDQ